MQLVDLLVKHNIPHRTEGDHHCRNGWVQLHCPWCDPSRTTWHLGIRLDDCRASCWRCGGKRVADVLMHYLQATFPEVRVLLDGVESVPRLERTKPSALVIPPGVAPLLPAHDRYLQRRGFRPRELEELWKIQGIGTASKLGWRLFIPITQHWQPVSWTTRSIQKAPALRYISASEEQETVPHKTLLYGEEYASNAVIVHEGPTDVWATGPGAVATLGTSYTQAQVRRLAKYSRRIICFDNDPQAQKRAKALADLLEPFLGETYVVMLSGKDAASSPRQELEQLRSLIR